MYQYSPLHQIMKIKNQVKFIEEQERFLKKHIDEYLELEKDKDTRAETLKYLIDKGYKDLII